MDDAAAVVREIVDVPAEDGLEFDATSIAAEPIREDGRKPRRPGSASGDARRSTHPDPDRHRHRRRFRAPRVKVYPAETIVAEKLHAMVRLGIANSRMKDFFDVYMLASLREFEEELLAKAGFYADAPEAVAVARISPEERRRRTG